jgi:hypothetical protein
MFMSTFLFSNGASSREYATFADPTTSRIATVLQQRIEAPQPQD